MGKRNNHITAPLWVPFEVHGNLKAGRKLTTDMGSNASKMWDRVCVCSVFAKCAKLFATHPLFSNDDLSAKR